MRPTVGGDALTSRSRKQSFADPEVTTPTALPGNGTPTTFFMASGDMLHASRSVPISSSTSSTFGVQSLEETVEGSTGDNEDEGVEQEDESSSGGGRRRSTLKVRLHGGRGQSSDSLGQASEASTADSSPARSNERQWPPTSISQPLTPLSSASPAPGMSFPNSPQSTSVRSYKQSDEDSTDDGASQAIASSEEGDTDVASAPQGSAPQLIMPSIIMPSRRPFTERGKDMGRLKVLIAGDSGLGKTSLIKAIVQICEDIVHVDPLSSVPPSPVSIPSRKSRKLADSARFNSTKQVMEFYASTRPYPSWWSEIDDSKLLRRRKSSGETVLERNLCFVDTPGYSSGMSMMESVETVVQYIEAQMVKTMSLTSLSDGDLLNILGGNGGFQVDVVFYLVSQNLKPVDIEFLKRVSLLTNFIPLIAKADLLSDEDIETTKGRISSELYTEGLNPFIFGPDGVVTTKPLTICSAPSNDEENMDASLLMSPDYVQPLIPSELALLVDQVFERENISWLRHSAAKKIISWYRTLTAMSMTTSSPRSFPAPIHPRSISSLITPSSTISSLSSANSRTMISYPNGPNSYAQAKIVDHTLREERLAQIHLAKWAGDLQRSLQNERARYEALARGERAIWLTERIGDCITDGSLVPVRQHEAAAPVSRKSAMALITTSGGGSPYHGIGNLTDPLGLIRWNSAMKKRGWLAFQVVGSFGILGALAVWAARNWGLSFEGRAGWNLGWLGGIE